MNYQHRNRNSVFILLLWIALYLMNYCNSVFVCLFRSRFGAHFTISQTDTLTTVSSLKMGKFTIYLYKLKSNTNRSAGIAYTPQAKDKQLRVPSAGVATPSNSVYSGQNRFYYIFYLYEKIP